MESIAAAVARIRLAVAPVVFLDTCVILDVVRAPLRDAAATVGAALELLAGATRVPELRTRVAAKESSSC